jgi:hypothetical protein
MPDWVCKKCKTEYLEVKLKPQCNNSKGCANGAFVTALVKSVTPTTVVSTLVPPTSYSSDGGEVRKNFSSKSSHKPNGPVYIHHGGKYAIAPDGSTHSSGKACWKGFKLTSQGWIYAGSYDSDLQKADRGGADLEESLPM